jgi:AAA domain (dynein-related subfamily)
VGRSNAITATITNGLDSAQVAIWVDDNGYGRAHARKTPVGSAKPQWQHQPIPASLMPYGPGTGSGASGTLQALIGSAIGSASTEWQIDGLWVVELTEHDNDELDAGTAMPKSLAERIRRTFDEEVPRSVRLNDITEVASWFTNGPIMALINKSDLTTWTEGVLTKVVAPAKALDPDEVGGITLSDGTIFVPRDFMGTTDVAFLRTAREHGLIVLLQGPPGTGKSRLVEAAFGEHELVVGNEDTTRADLVGTYVQDDTGLFQWIDGPLIRAAEANGGEGCVLFVDEAFLVDPRVLSVLYSMLDGRGVLPVTENPRRGTVKAGPNFYVVFASNPDVPGAILSEALASRCHLKPEYLTDYEVISKIIGPSHDDIVTVARNMETKRQNQEVMWAPQARDLLTYAKIAATPSMGLPVALANLIANCGSDSDAETLTEVIARTMGVSNIKPFRI